MSRQNVRDGRIKIWQLLAIFAIGAVLVMLLLPAQQGTYTSRIPPCKNNLKQLGVALHNYHDDNSFFPIPATSRKDGTAMHSWRVALLPYLGVDRKFNSNEPWNSPANKAFAAPTPGIYRWPGSQSLPLITDYVAIVGPETAWHWHRDKGGRIRDITDGTANTLMITEMYDSGIEWTEPRDVQAKDIERSIYRRRSGLAFSSSHVWGRKLWYGDYRVPFVHVLAADGSVHSLKPGIDPSVLSALMTARGGEEVSRQDW